MFRRLQYGLAAAAVVPWTSPAAAGPALPMPCAPGTCPSGVTGFVSAGSAKAPSQTGNTLTVTQQSTDVTLNWASFNIGASGKVVFQQPSANSIALNRIYDASPSSLFGTLSANGQIYLINPNGLLFGATATINVGGLLASTLNLSDTNFAAGILSPGLVGKPALESPLDPATGLAAAQPITVQSGASLVAADGGRLLLAAPVISNAGVLAAPDGQVILAAGQKLYLQASPDSTLRGLIVEVDNPLALLNPPAGVVSGTVTNSGTVSAPRGNVTLTGLMVNQQGLVSATTSVAANGSVILQAADGFAAQTGGAGRLIFSATEGGTVTLGPGSVTKVLPDPTDTKTAVAAQTQLQSKITITGQQVFMDGAAIDAPSGQLDVLAAANPATFNSGGNTAAQIRIDAGTTIDLAGSVAELPMSANLITVQLRSNELADDPTQRGGPLQSTSNNTVTVTVDTRADGGKGTPIANLGSAIAAVGQTIQQRTETGGAASFQSEGDVVLAPGATIDVSGGQTNYLGGTIQTTKLVGANGQLYDIGSANPLLSYTGVVNPTFTQTSDKWGVKEVLPTPGLSQYESGYVQGAAAGSVQFAAPTLVLDGTLRGAAVSGPFQRSAPPAGGTLTIGVPTGVFTASNFVDYLTPPVEIVGSAPSVTATDGTPVAAAVLSLPAAYLTTDGFTNTQVYSNTSVTLPAGVPLQLPGAASLTLVAPRVDVDASVVAPDGRLTFENVLTAAAPATNAPRPGVAIGPGVLLDVSGQWTNDNLPANGIGMAPTLQNAGLMILQLTATGSELAVGNGVTLKADGGGWLQSGGAVAYGQGGKITLDASPPQAALQLGANVELAGFGTGTATGGTFSLLAPRIALSAGDGTAWSTAQTVDDLTSPGVFLQVYAPLFAQDGFAAINLTATGPVVTGSDVLTVARGTVIDAQTRTLQLGQGYFGEPTGAALDGFAAPGLEPLYLRPAASVSLNAIREADDVALGATGYGLVDVQTGARISVDPGGTVSIAGEGGVAIAGTLRAPGGTIAVSVPSPTDVNSGTAQVTDPGFVPSLSLDLAPTAQLDVSGTTILKPSSQGLLTGTVQPGGTVSLLAGRGTVVVEAGATIDIAGTSAPLDVPNPANIAGTTRETIASAGGSLILSSPESISLLGAVNATAGVGPSGVAAAGSLELDLFRGPGSVVQSAAPSLPDGQLDIELVNSTTGSVPSAADSNLAVLGVSQLEAAGIDSLTLRAGSATPNGNILLDATQLTLGRQLILDAGTLSANGTTTLTAPYVAIGNSVPLGTATAAMPSAGTGNLTVNAGQLTLFGSVTLQGATRATLSSAGDVQLQGTIASNTAGPTTGALVTSGNLTITAQRLYPDTYTDFTIASVAGNGATVALAGSGASPGAPLSADGALSVSADNVTVSGSLYAPFGAISLAANQSLTVAKGALVSVSGAGLDLPFGETQLNKGEWVYDVPNGQVNLITGVPSKQISLSAPSIAIQPGATSNVAGGGDLYAYEWVPGTGGTYDNLAATYGGAGGNVSQSSIANLYAILPSARNQAGPVDSEESVAAVPGQTIYLSGGAGIAPGFYALLPPRYALAPGAVLIQLEPGYVSAGGGTLGTLANGVPVIGGYLSTGLTGLHQGGGLTEYEGVAIYPSGYAQKLANYSISDASSYFAAQAQTDGSGRSASPADAGTFSLDITAAATNSLSLGGTVLTAPASGGAGALVNISAPDLEITATTTAGDTGAIQVPALVLQDWHAGSLTIGGIAAPATRSADAATPTAVIAVAANSVTVDAGVVLTADQIEVVAQQAIDVRGGASLQSTSAANGKTLTTLPSTVDVQLTDTSPAANPLPQAALLAVSDLALPVVVRGSTTGATPATITLEPAAEVGSGGALVLDAPGPVTIADGSLNGKGASWSLASSSIAFVAPGASTADTLTIDAALLASLQQAGAVRLASAGSLDLATPVILGVNANGSPSLASLTLIADDINNVGGGHASFGAATVVLGGNGVPTGAGTLSAAMPGSGTLGLVADTLTLGPGIVTVNGFGQTTAQVAGAIVGKGAATLNAGGNLTLNAAELTAAPDAADEPGATVIATGALTLGAPVAPAQGVAVPSLAGGSLTLQAASIDDSGAIAVRSGVAKLSSGGALHLAPGATIDASGAALTVVNQSVATPGGSVTLAAGGDVTVDAGAVINVSGIGTAPAGSVSIQGGTGTVTLAGTLRGAGQGAAGGSLSIDAGALAGGLSALVGNPGIAGFTEAVDVRVRTGSLTLASGSDLTSGTIALTADSGVVDIAGSLKAPSGAQRGLIALAGGQAIVVESGATLAADGSNGGRGGEIDLSSVSAVCGTTACTVSGSITLTPGSTIATGGTGTLVLRAPAVTDANNDLVAINPGATGIGADISQVGQVIFEPVFVSPTTATTLNSPSSATGLTQVTRNAVAYLNASNGQGVTNQASLAARLSGAAANGNPGQVEVGVELQDTNASDSLTLKSFDLSQYSAPQGQGQAGGQVVDLVIRSAGPMTVSGTVSDGFIAGSGAANPTVLTDLPSASIDLVAGADLTSANSLAVQTGVSAALTLGPKALVRTGSGDLALAAAGDVVLQSNTTGGATVYTGGVDGAAPMVLGKGSARQTAYFPTDGGSVTVSAGGNVIGAPFLDPKLDGGDLSVTGWQVRGTTTQTPQGTPAGTTLGVYGLNFDRFDWNLGALAGGDLTVTAAGAIDNLSAATANSSPDGNTTIQGGGGGLRLTAGGDIGSAQVYIANGVGTLTSGGGLIPIVPTSIGTNVGSSIALGDSQVAVWARQGVQVDAIYNPTFIPASAAGGVTTPQFFTYGADSAVRLSSTDGSVTLELVPTTSIMGLLLGPNLMETATDSPGFLTLPANLTLAAPQKDVVFQLDGAGAILAPSASGQLDLVAGRDILGNGYEVAMSDSFAGAYPTVSSVVKLQTGELLNNGLAGFEGAIHAGDTQPALVTAGRDIDSLGLSIPKAADVNAGRDIVNISYQGQNVSSSDTTLLVAGRDLTYPVQAAGAQISVGGPGAVDIFAGRNVELGTSVGITTTGNLENPNLATPNGADLTLAVGYGAAGADYANFIADVVTPAAPYQNLLVAYVEAVNTQTAALALQEGKPVDPGLTHLNRLTYAQAQAEFATLSPAQQAVYATFVSDSVANAARYQGQLIAYVEAQTGQQGLSLAQAQAQFANLGLAQQAHAIDTAFFNELLASGRVANSGSGQGFAEGLAAIDALYPYTGLPTAASPGPYAGNLSLISSEIYTLSGGNISILVPGGNIDVGLAFTPAGLIQKPASQLGIVAEGAGNVAVFAQGDVNVNASRIFTLGGGNIQIWSDTGSIDAGNGSKSSLSVPPPQILINKDGSITLDYGASLAAGSGIRTIQTDASVAAGNVDLAAPVGSVNAGDAGIGAAGNINIAAAHVIGVANINFGGSASGVPSDLSGLGASLSGATGAAAGTTNSSTSAVADSAAARETSPLAQAALSWLDVFVTGLGEENCRQDDIECLKRQKTAAP